MLGLGGHDWSSHIRLDECENCGHVYYANPPSEDFIERFYAEEWNSVREGTVNVAPHRKTEDFRVAKLAQAIGGLSPELPVLEIGCGTGAMLAGMQAAGFKNLYGTEASNNRARISGARFPSRIFGGGLSGVPEGLRFQLIYSHHVMEHMSEPGRALSWMRDRLLPGGRIVVIVPDAKVEPVLSQILFLPHLHSFSRHSLIMMGRMANLEAAQWKRPHGRAEISFVFYRPGEEGSLLQNSNFEPVLDPARFREQSQRDRYLKPFDADAPGKTVYLRLHHSERDQAEIAAKGGIENAAPLGRMVTSLLMPLIARLADGKVRRRLEKKILRTRFVKALIVPSESTYPIISSQDGEAPVHLK